MVVVRVLHSNSGGFGDDGSSGSGGGCGSSSNGTTDACSS